MGSGRITLAPGLMMPADELASMVVAALGIRGSGKSNAMGVIVEGLLDAGVQVIVLDYVGIWFSLRLDESGRRASAFKIPVLGGQHGDTALFPNAGQVVAEALAQSGSPAVLDVSTFTKTARTAFGTEFAEALFSAKKLHPGPTFLVLEEAQRYIPQKLYKGQERMLGAFEEIAETGRNYGLGLGMISLRPQRLAKDVLNLTELLLAFQTNGVLERKAIAEWVQEKDAEGRSEVNNELPSLPRGEALVWSPSWLRVYGKYRVKKKSTYDAGATPLKARAAVKVKPLDLQALERAMASVVEEGKANDPMLLKAEVTRLRRELDAVGRRGSAGRATPPPPPQPVKLVSAPFVPPALVAGLRKLADRIPAELTRLVALADEVKSPSREAVGPVVASSAGRQRRLEGQAKEDVGALRKVLSVVESPVGRRGEDGSLALSKAARLLLLALAQRNGKATDRELSVLSGYRITSSSFDNGLSELRTAGYLVGPPEARSMTEAGAVAAGDVSPAPTGRKLLDWWLHGRNARGRKRLGKCEATLLQVLYEHGTLSREELSEKSGYRITSSSFDNGISAIRRLALADGPDGGDLTIADVFREGE